MKALAPVMLAILLAWAPVGTPARASPAPTGPLRGMWGGTTSQRDAIHFRVDGHRSVVALRITADIRAETCDVRISLIGTRLGVPISAADTFRAKLAHGPSIAVVKGAFASPRRASGTFRADYHGSCGRGHAEGTWRATHR
jgi:hypothetical protein